MSLNNRGPSASSFAKKSSDQLAIIDYEIVEVKPPNFMKNVDSIKSQSHEHVWSALACIDPKGEKGAPTHMPN